MKKNDIIHHIRRSKKALESAKILLQNEMVEDAISRAYYSILHSAQAALLVKDVMTKSHSAVRNLFGMHLIKPGLIEKEWSLILSDEFSERTSADYDAYFEPELEDGENMVLEAERFLNRINQYLRSHDIEI